MHAIAELARMEASDVAAQAYEGQETKFGPDYLIPQPFDPRLLMQLAPAVAKAAMDSGVATRPIDDMDAYRERLHNFVFAPCSFCGGCDLSEKNEEDCLGNTESPVCGGCLWAQGIIECP